MSVTKPAPTNDILKALETGLANFLSPSDPLFGILIGSKPGQREMLHMYAVGLDDLAAGVANDRVRATGWRFVAVGTDGDGIVVDVTAPPMGTAPKVAAMQRGPHLAKILAAIQALDTLPDLQSGEFELGTLNVPGLLIETLWLKSPQSQNDWVVPFHVLIEEIQSMHNYRLSDFTATLKTLAATRLQFDDSADN